MAKPQQPELARSGRGATDPASVKTAVQVTPTAPAADGSLAPVPEDNRPGHHPEHHQDKPVEAFAAKARRLAREAHRADDERPDSPPAPPASGRPASGPGLDLVRSLAVGSFPLLALVDAAGRPDQAWAEVGQPKLWWLAGIALAPGLGSWAYVTRVRPRLRAAEMAPALPGA